MNFTTETNTIKRKILIVDRHQAPLVHQLKQQLLKYDNEVFISPAIPHTLSRFDMCFFIDEPKKTLEKIMAHHTIPCVFIVRVSPKKAEYYNQLIHQLHIRHVKLIHVNTESEVHPDDIDKILWFSFARSDETFLNFHLHKTHHPVMAREPEVEIPRYITKHNLWRPRLFLILIPILIVIVHIMFIPSLALGNYYIYKGAKALQAGKMEDVIDFSKKSESAVSQSKQLYTFARPTLLLFSVAVTVDNIYQIDESANNVLQESLPLYQTGKAYVALLLKKDKTSDEQNLLLLQQKDLQSSMSNLYQDLTFLYQKIPEWDPRLKKVKDQMKTGAEAIDTARKIVPFMDSIFARNTEKKYLVMFANNMELRPGGGFIGSFGVATTKNYSLADLHVYDVYDADGQLKAHIEPPDPIRKYLHQPHWFLRDSAFSPDFPENYKQAQFFLDREMGMRNFDGGILITTTAIQNIIGGMGDLYIPDFNEIVNKDNFYLKAQLYAEKGFFPGSTQKKRFLSAVMDQIMIRLEGAATPALFQMLEKSLNEKQIVAYFKDEALQQNIDSQYWSGRTLNPTCTTSSKNCIVDYLMPVDANLGVNKANFFVSRTVSLNVSVDSSGKTHNKLIMHIKNDSVNDAFPGGTYKDYVQLLIPRDSVVKGVTKNGVMIEDYDTSAAAQQTIGFYTEIPPQTTAEITIDYQLDTKLQNGQGVYQLVMQKQIGSPNYDFNLTMSLPKNIYITNQNFSPLVNENTIQYNTTIKSDKIFFIELLKA